jgi:hypothetical protein
MRTASWVILAIVGALTMLGSMASCYVAYRGAGDEQIGSETLSQITAGNPQRATALRARRGTAAAYAAGFATLFLAITLRPYRRGDTWAWWALLAGTVVMSAVILLRVPFLDTRVGAGAGLITLVVVGLALALDAGRLRSGARPAAPPS